MSKFPKILAIVIITFALVSLTEGYYKARIQMHYYYTSYIKQLSDGGMQYGNKLLWVKGEMKPDYIEGWYKQIAPSDHTNVVITSIFQIK